MLIMYIGYFACFHAISLECSHFSKIATLFHAVVALKLLVSLISRLVTCSARIVVEHTDRQTDKLVYWGINCAGEGKAGINARSNNDGVGERV